VIFLQACFAIIGGRYPLRGCYPISHSVGLRAAKEKTSLKEPILNRKSLTPSYRVNSDNRIVKRSETLLLLVFDNGVLYNNVFAKGDIQNAFQQVFLDEISLAGNGSGRKILVPRLKTYPEVIWDVLHGVKRFMAASLPCSLEKVRLCFGS